MMTDDEAEAMGSAAAAITRMAYDDGASALIMHPYGGPPPRAEFWLGLMREVIEAEGPLMGCLNIGMGEESGLLPLVEMHPVLALQAILSLRLSGMLPSINWVVLVSDTYTFVTDEPNVAWGTAEEAFRAGNPDAAEAVLAICVAPDGPGYDVSQTYVRTPGGFVWEDPVPRKGPSTGDIPRLMQEVVLA